MKRKCILFSISSLGLGHAARELPLIRELSKNNRIIILSYGNALKFLKEELGNTQDIVFYEKKMESPPWEEGSNFIKYNLYLIVDALISVFTIKKENKQTKKICEREQVDIIISDGNYGSFSRNIPCVLVTHQIEFQIRNPLYRKLSLFYNKKSFKKYDKIIIPDYMSKENNLSGKLSHNRTARKLPVLYCGILSQFKKMKTSKKIKYLIILSGFLHEHKEEFFSNILKELKNKKGKKVFIMGDYSTDYEKNIGKDIKIYSSFKGMDKNKIFNSSEIVISRTGYTTIMDLVELEKKAILIPTPNQSEQEYLAHYHSKKNLFNIVQSQKCVKIDFKKVKSPGRNFHKTDKSVGIIINELNSLIKQHGHRVSNN